MHAHVQLLEPVLETTMLAAVAFWSPSALFLNFCRNRAPLGVGAMGEVYRACDTNLNRDVALKVLPERFLLDPGRLTRFTREAQVLATLKQRSQGNRSWIEGWYMRNRLARVRWTAISSSACQDVAACRP